MEVATLVPIDVQFENSRPMKGYMLFTVFEERLP